ISLRPRATVRLVPPRIRSVLLTGGAGFIGSHLATALDADTEVFVVDNLYRQAQPPARLGARPGVHFLRADVRDLEAVRSFVPPDLSHIVHCAAVAGVLTIRDDAAQALRANLEASFAVADLAAGLAKLEHLVSFSSSEVYGPDAAHTEEDVV